MSCVVFSASAKGQQEITITAAQSQYCFEGLSPESLYSATVFVQTPNLEGPGVSVKERTCEWVILSSHNMLRWLGEAKPNLYFFPTCNYYLFVCLLVLQWSSQHLFQHCHLPLPLHPQFHLAGQVISIICLFGLFMFEQNPKQPILMSQDKKCHMVMFLKCKCAAHTR